MKLCKHKNVLELHAAFNVMEELWLVMPFMNKGSVLDIIRDRVQQIKRKLLEKQALPLTVSSCFLRSCFDRRLQYHWPVCVLRAGSGYPDLHPRHV